MTAPITDDELQALAELEAEATPGPWYAWPGIGWPEGLAEAIGGIGAAAGVFLPIRSRDGDPIAFFDDRAERLRGCQNQQIVVCLRNVYPAMIVRIRADAARIKELSGYDSFRELAMVYASHLVKLAEALGVPSPAVVSDRNEMAKLRVALLAAVAALAPREGE